ncbi:MAG: hypothetical protein ACO1TE_28775 [Prosthecobacter sp.]
MSSEILAHLATMSVEEMLELRRELDERLNEIDSADISETPEYKAAISELVEERLQHYRAHPESAAPWEEVQQRLQKRMMEWKASRMAQ